MTPIEAKAEAIRIAGGPSAVSRKLQITPQALWKWSQVPVGRVSQLVELAGGAVTREQLRPDIFGKPVARRAKATA